MIYSYGYLILIFILFKLLFIKKEKFIYLFFKNIRNCNIRILLRKLKFLTVEQKYTNKTKENFYLDEN